MADPTLSTTVSRRTMLAGGAAAVSLPAIASLPAANGPCLDLPMPDPDARLFHCIAVAERLRKEHAQACRLLDRLRESLRGQPGYRELPGMGIYSKRWDAAWRTGRRDAMLRCSDLFHRYARAVRAAVAVPAHSVRGVHAKLGLALIAARRGDARVYLYEAHDYVEAAVADLKRIVDRERKAQGGTKTVLHR